MIKNYKVKDNTCTYIYRLNINNGIYKIVLCMIIEIYLKIYRNNNSKIGT